jgi:mercuric ion transport protein
MTVGAVNNSRERTGSGALFVGGLAAILGSTCCLGPLVLVALGLSGAWIGNLTRLEPYRPFFIAASLVALFFAGRRIFRPAQACEPEEGCAAPPTGNIYKIVFAIVSMLVLIALVFPYVIKFFYQVSDEERNRYEESESHGCSSWWGASTNRAGLGITQDGNLECLQHDLRGVPDNRKEGTPEGSGSVEDRCAVRKETSSSDLR